MCVWHAQISWRKLLRVALKPRNSWKFSPSKVYCYTVCIMNQAPGFIIMSLFSIVDHFCWFCSLWAPWPASTLWCKPYQLLWQHQGMLVVIVVHVLLLLPQPHPQAPRSFQHNMHDIVHTDRGAWGWGYYYCTMGFRFQASKSIVMLTPTVL